MAKNKYKLTRLNDGLVKHGNIISWIEYNTPKDGNVVHKKPAIGRGLVISMGMSSWWQTTSLTSFSIEEDGTILFTTLNSNYKLEKL